MTMKFMTSSLVTEHLHIRGYTHKWPQIWMGEDVAIVGDRKGVAMNAQLGRHT